MKKIILAAFMAACGLQMSAQQNLFVAQDLESAIVNKDNTVTFNFKAPDARRYRLQVTLPKGWRDNTLAVWWAQA